MKWAFIFPRVFGQNYNLFGVHLVKCSVELPFISALRHVNQNVKTYLTAYCPIYADPLTYLPVEAFLNQP